MSYIIAPTAPEPYQTLSMLHEEMADIDNAYQVGAGTCHAVSHYWTVVHRLLLFSSFISTVTAGSCI